MSTIAKDEQIGEEIITLPTWQFRQDWYGLWWVKMVEAKEWDGPYVKTEHAVAFMSHHVGGICAQYAIDH